MSSLENRTAIIVGAGIGGLSLAALLAKKGFQVKIYEKNSTAGGRARIFDQKGFRFDAGPSWYMMPDVFEEFFALLGENIEDHLKLKKLSPSYRIFLQNDDKQYDFFADRQKNKELFDALELGAGDKLVAYLEESKRQYQVAKNEFMYKNYNSIFDFFNGRVLREGRKLQIYRNMEQIINKNFSNELLRKVMKFQMILLGTAPKDAPGMYQLMNHVDFDLGVWYPDGGISKLPEAIQKIAEKHGANFNFNQPVTKIITQDKTAVGVELSSGQKVYGDLVISNADRHHAEMNLLESSERDLDERYWNKRKLAPSALILYLGLNKTFPSLTHHNLLFSKDWDENLKQVFDYLDFPSSPSVYVCAPSKSDPTVAPPDSENLFVLVPISAGISYTQKQLDEWVDKTLSLLETSMKLDGLKQSIVYKRVYSIKDFSEDYNSYKGSALGLAHTLGQSAVWRPNNVSKKIKNLYHVGSYTNPGIGMPICVISAQNAYKRIMSIGDPHPLTNL